MIATTTSRYQYITKCNRPKRVLCHTVFNKVRAPPRKPKTGGGGNNDDQNNDKHLERIRNYNIGALHRCFDPSSEVTERGLVGAMVQRWGKPYVLVLTVYNHESLWFMAVHLTPEQYDRDDKLSLDEMMGVLCILNSYGLSGEFVDYIKYDASLCEPSRVAYPYILSLNIPVNGARLCEWNS